MRRGGEEGEREAGGEEGGEGGGEERARERRCRSGKSGWGMGGEANLTVG